LLDKIRELCGKIGGRYKCDLLVVQINTFEYLCFDVNFDKRKGGFS